MRAITDDERRQVVAVIYDYVGEPATPASLRGLIGWDLSVLPPGLNGFRIAGSILDLALRHAAADLFIHVVKTCDPSGALHSVQQLVAALVASPESWSAAPSMVLWMPTAKDPFIDRDAVRTSLAAMADGLGPPAITIEGPVGSGKRTISRYIEDLAGRSNTFTLIPTELRAEPQQGLLVSLVTNLRYELGLSPAGSWSSPVGERAAELAANDIARELLITAGPCVWWVVNVFDTRGIEDGVLRFVDELLGHLEAPNATLAQRLRIVLLAADVATLPMDHVPPTPTRHVLPTIAVDPVRAWFEATVPGKTPAHYDAAAATVIEQVDRQGPPPAQRLNLLALSCRAAHRNLSQVP